MFEWSHCVGERDLVVARSLSFLWIRIRKHEPFINDAGWVRNQPSEID
jgi:hypothetical protein